MGTTTNTHHPFAPLTPEEIEAAAALVRAARASSEHLRFVTVRLHEPPAEVAHTFRPGDQVPREAFFVLLDKTPGQSGAYEAIVNLTEGRVTSWKRIGEGSGQPSIILEEFFAAEDAVKADARFRAALERRGITEADLHRVRVDPWSAGNYGNPDEDSRRVLRTERDAQRDIAQDRSWKIINPNVRNPTNGSFVGYELCPGVGANSLLLATPDSSISRRAAFARHHLWVTPSRLEEQFPAGDYPNQHPGGAGLPAWTAANRSIEDTVLTLWHTVGVMHNPRVEDWPVKHAGFMLRPFNFFEGNPGLDVHPSKNHGDNCEHHEHHI